jgi:hypothetical protein
LPPKPAEAQAECQRSDRKPNAYGWVVDVEATGTNFDGDIIIEFGVCLSNMAARTAKYEKILGSW